MHINVAALEEQVVRAKAEAKLAALLLPVKVSVLTKDFMTAIDKSMGKLYEKNAAIKQTQIKKAFLGQPADKSVLERTDKILRNNTSTLYQANQSASAPKNEVEQSEQPTPKGPRQ